MPSDLGATLTKENVKTIAQLRLLSMVSALPKDAKTGRTLEACLRVVLNGLGP